MKKILIIIFALFFISEVCHADKLQVPFRCDQKRIIEEFKKNGFKLDASGADYTSDSWGFIDNKGMEYWLITYNPITKEEFEKIGRIVLDLNKR